MTTAATQRTLARSLPALALCAALQATLCASLAHAQVAVLRVDPAADALCAVLESAITDAQLVRDPGYFAEANNQGLDPSADATLEGLVPLLGLRLAVVPQSADDRRVNVDFRDGRTGARCSSTSALRPPLAARRAGSRQATARVRAASRAVTARMQAARMQRAATRAG